MPDFSVKITGDVSELTKATTEAKEQLDQASKSVEILGDLIGVKVPDSIKNLLASSELLGPVLSEAFAPLTAITFGIELFEKLSDKIKEVTNDMAGWDTSAQAMYADLVKNNERIVKFNENLEIEKLQLKEIGKTGTELITQQIKNTADEAAILGNRVKELNKELEKMNGSHQEVEIIAAGAGPDQMERLVEVKNTAGQTAEVLKQWTDRTKEVNKELTDIQNRLNEIKEIKTPAKNAQQEVAKKKEAIAAGEQILAANKSLADSERQLAVDTAHAKVQQGKITAAQEEDIILGSFQKERDATIKFLRDREALLLSDTTKGVQEKKNIQETTAIEIHAAEVKSQDETIKVV